MNHVKGGVTALGLVGLITFLLFIRTVNFQFIGLDDRLHLDHPNVRFASVDNAIEIWSHPYEKMYMPLTYTVIMWVNEFARNDDFGGSPNEISQHAYPQQPYNPAYYHFLIITLHAINALLVAWLILGFVNSPALALFGGLLFGIHPIQVQTVCWISNLSGVLATLFSLAALICVVSVAKDKANGCFKKRFLWALSTFLFLCSLLAKPIGSTLPLVAFAILIYLNTPKKRAFLFILPWLILGLPLFVMTANLQSGQDLVVAPLAFPQRILVALDTINFYFVKLIWPNPLLVDYTRTPIAAISSAAIYFVWVPLVAFFILWRKRKANPLISLGVLISILILLPLSGLKPFVFQIFSTVSDRYFYFPMFGITLAAVGFLIWLEQKGYGRKAAIASAALICVLGVKSSWQSGYWKDNTTLFTYSLEQNPKSWFFHNLFGLYLESNQKYPDAEAQFEEAMKISKNTVGFDYLRKKYLAKGMFDELINMCTRYIKLDATDPMFYFHRAIAYDKKKNRPQAKIDAEKALSLSPGNELIERFLESLGSGTTRSVLK